MKTTEASLMMIFQLSRRIYAKVFLRHRAKSITGSPILRRRLMARMRKVSMVDHLRVVSRETWGTGTSNMETAEVGILADAVVIITDTMPIRKSSVMTSLAFS
jgi:hypothetical protein